MKAFCDNARINKRIHTDEDGKKRYGAELTSLESGKSVFLEVKNEDRADVLRWAHGDRDAQGRGRSD